ncbi:MAG TPA: response regulator [Pyrinomonadaceae bacterium]|nr:response regulator [Pyrinomonadaceae bacterium]
MSDGRGEDERPTVLVVDDYESLRTLLKNMLTTLGCRVVEASDGAEAVEAARRERPGLILMDLVMPSLDGFGAVQRIRRQAGLQGVVIVAMSGHESADVRADALEAGCQDFLNKPVAYERLKEVLGKFLPGRKPEEFDR